MMKFHKYKYKVCVHGMRRLWQRHFTQQSSSFRNGTIYHDIGSPIKVIGQASCDVSRSILSDLRRLDRWVVDV